MRLFFPVKFASVKPFPRTLLMDYVTNDIMRQIRQSWEEKKQNTDAHVSLVGMKIESWKGATRFA